MKFANKLKKFLLDYAEYKAEYLKKRPAMWY